MSDKKKQPSLLELLGSLPPRRSQVRSDEMRPILPTTHSHAAPKVTMGPAATRRESHVRSEEMRPMLPSQQQSHHVAPKGPAAAPTRRENFEIISVRDKSDATAKRGFKVQVPKRMLTYSALIFIVAPLFLFGYMEVHNTKHHNYHPEGDSKGHEYLPTDILSSLLTDSPEEDALNSTDASLDAWNTTSIGDIATTNSTVLEEGSEAKNALKDSTSDADETGQTNSDEQVTDEKDKLDDDQPETRKGERRVL
jgi:hypothetical protein